MLMRTWVEIDTSALEENTRQLRQYVAPAQVIAVVKGDAYGHGLLPCAAAVRRGGAAMLAMGDVSEARTLRRAGDGGAILVLGPVMAGEVPELLAIGADIVVSDATILPVLVAEARRSGWTARVHLAVDTDFGREGFTPSEISTVLDYLRAQPDIVIASVMSHLHTTRDSTSAARQLALFTQVTAGLPREVWRHIANSGGIALGREYFLDAVRLGLAIYGLSQRCRQILPLQSCLTWRTRVAEVYWRLRGTVVGYAPGYRLIRDSRLGLLPVGFAHGYPRTARGPVLVRGHRVPILGNVNMLSMVIDLTDVPYVTHGDIVTLLGSDGENEVTAADLCQGPDLIPNLFTCTLTRLVHRDLAVS